MTGNWSGTLLPPLVLEYAAPRIVGPALMPSAAKNVRLDPPSQHLTLMPHKPQILFLL